MALLVVTDRRAGRAGAGRRRAGLADLVAVLDNKLAALRTVVRDLGGLALVAPERTLDAVVLRGRRGRDRGRGRIDLDLHNRNRSLPAGDLDRLTKRPLDTLGLAKRDTDVAVAAVQLGPLHVIQVTNLDPLASTQPPAALPAVPKGTAIGSGVLELTTNLDPALADRVNTALGGLESTGDHRNCDDRSRTTLVRSDHLDGLSTGERLVPRRGCGRRGCGRGDGRHRNGAGGRRGRREGAVSLHAYRVRGHRAGGRYAGRSQHSKRSDRPKGNPDNTH